MVFIAEVDHRILASLNPLSKLGRMLVPTYASVRGGGIAAIGSR
jgi:hypothetical protein